MNYSLKEIADIIGGKLIGNEDVVVKGIAYDSRLIKEDQIFAPFVGEKTDGHKYVAELFSKGIRASFWQQDCSLEMPKGNLIVVDDVLSAIQLLAEKYRNSLKIPFIGITGSSGKTSTKDIIASTLSAKYKVYKTVGNHNNKLGVPMTLLNMDDTSEVAVIEMGIDDIGIMDQLVKMVKPDYTVITSIAPAHISQFKTIDKIVEQKCLINKYLPKDGCCFFNRSCYGVEKCLRQMNLQDRMKSFGFDDECDLSATDFKLEGKYSYFKVKQYRDFQFKIPILGKHQVGNALSAILVGQEFSMTAEEIQRGFEKIKLTPRRMELKEIKGNLIIDDSYNSNPVSLVASLECFAQYDKKYHKIVVIGDMLELGDNSAKLHKEIAEKIDCSQFDKIYLIGHEMKNLSEGLNEKKIDNYHFDNWNNCLELIKNDLRKDNIIFFKASNGMDFSGLIATLED